MTLVRSTFEDKLEFFTEVEKLGLKCPGAPKKSVLSKQMTHLMNRWETRGVVRKLMFENPKNPRYWTAIANYARK